MNAANIGGKAVALAEIRWEHAYIHLGNLVV